MWRYRGERKTNISFSHPFPSPLFLPFLLVYKIVHFLICSFSILFSLHSSALNPPVNFLLIFSIKIQTVSFHLHGHSIYRLIRKFPEWKVLYIKYTETKASVPLIQFSLVFRCRTQRSVHAAFGAAESI